MYLDFIATLAERLTQTTIALVFAWELANPLCSDRLCDADSVTNVALALHRVYSRFIRGHIRRVHVCLAVTCHLHFGRVTGIFYVLLG